MKKTIVLVFILTSFTIYSQKQSENQLEYLGKINLGLHGLEFSYEYAFAKNFIWENNIGIGMGMSNYYRKTYYTFDIDRPTPFFKSEIKYIYNRKKRGLKGKPLINNSGAYIGLQAKYSFGSSKSLEKNKALLTEIHLGSQKNIGKRFLFNYHFGLGLLSDFDTKIERLSPTAGIRLGYILF